MPLFLGLLRTSSCSLRKQDLGGTKVKSGLKSGLVGLLADLQLKSVGLLYSTAESRLRVSGSYLIFLQDLWVLQAAKWQLGRLNMAACTKITAFQSRSTLLRRGNHSSAASPKQAASTTPNYSLPCRGNYN